MVKNSIYREGETLDLQFERKNDTLLVRIKGELDMHTADDLRQRVEHYLQEYPSLKNMIMELKGVGFIDSSGVGVILGRYKTLKARGGQIGAANLNPTIKRIFEMSGMLKIMPVYDTMEDAEQAFGIKGR